MRFSNIFFFLMLLGLQAQDLQEYRWENRVVILIEDDKNPEKYLQQKEVLNQNKEGLLERDIIILVPKEDKRIKLMKELGLDTAFTGLVLIGKDGGIKLKQETLVSRDQLFTLIDGMPMRKAEIRRKKQKSH